MCSNIRNMHLKSKIIKKISYDEISNETFNGILCVIFIDEDTDDFKLAIPSYLGIEQLSQAEKLQKSTYHSGFVEIDGPIPDVVSDDMFVIVYDEKTREIRQMTQLTDFYADCTEYFYQHLDPQECIYPTSVCKRKKMKFI